MPGETFQQALDAAQTLRDRGISSVVTHLGENIKELAEATAITNHYLEVLDQIHQRKLDTHISVKLTELGLDQNPEACYTNVKHLLQEAGALNNFVWIDMEGSNYTGATLSLYKRARAEFPNVGVCLQSYLYRTAEDLQQLLPLSPAIRLVKGAYAEPAGIAFAKKSDTDENFFRLAEVLLRRHNVNQSQVGIATHDQKLIERIVKVADSLGCAKDAWELQMLFGIRTRDQLRLQQNGLRVRVLISYGASWFPWYMRRLAERPANVLFVLRNLV